MTSVMLLALLQSVVSVEAGLVNHTLGEVNVVVNENVAEGAPIRTGKGAYVEILLNPGSFLRLDQNSEAVIEETALSGIRVRVVSGAAILEAGEILDEFPVTVLTGELQTIIVDDGIYLFGDGKARVLAGKLHIPDAALAYEKGWTVYFDRLYRARRSTSDLMATGVERWSAGRASVLAQTNRRAYQSLASSGIRRNAIPSARSWYWMPGLNTWTFFPNRRYLSPYGYTHYSTFDLNQLVRARRGGGPPTTRAGTVPRPDNGGGGLPATGSSRPEGGAASPPAPTFRDIVPAKSGPTTQQRN